MRTIHLMLTLVIGCAYAHRQVDEEYAVPEPKFKLSQGGGFTVSIREEGGIQLFAFHGNVNKRMVGHSLGAINGDVAQKSHGKWTYSNKTTKLRKGDVINYWVFVMRNGRGYMGDVHSYTFKAEDFMKLHKKPFYYHHKIAKRFARRNFLPDYYRQNDDDDDYEDYPSYPHSFHMRPHKHDFHMGHFHKDLRYGYPHQYGRYHGCNHRHFDREMPTARPTTRTTTKLPVTTTTKLPVTTTIESKVQNDGTTIGSTTTTQATVTFPLIDVRFGQK